MQVTFTMAEPEAAGRRLADAELVLGGELAGLKLAGFAVRKDKAGELYVTFPGKAFGIGGTRRYFDFLRTADGCLDPVKALKARVLGAYLKLSHAGRVPGASVTVQL